MNEFFSYDSMDRLTSYTNVRRENEGQGYNDNGTIATNAIGNYAYDSSKPFRNNGLEMSEGAQGYYNNRQGLIDGTMEDMNGWVFGPDTFLAYDTSKKHSGKYSLVLKNSAVEKTTTAGKAAIANSVATSYTVSGFAYNENTTSKAYLVMETSTGSTSEVAINTIGSGAWAEFSQPVLVPATIKKLGLRLEKVAGGKVWFDDIMIRKTADITSERRLAITYNMFNNPVEITEPGKDKISYNYNGSMTRSAMYYGSMAADKMQRPLRKMYSSDGRVEIKHNIVDNTIEFITYIGGDGYTAPVALKKVRSNSEYLYLHRDYQGSILAISDESGKLLEKRLFDAWGNIKEVYDGQNKLISQLTVLDRGYTGHEHLQSVGLIHMNGRLYDPKLHRFLQPDNYVQDPLNSQNYNRYGYVYNNPMKYTDPSGELVGGGLAEVLFATGNPEFAIGTIAIGAIWSLYENWDNWHIKDWFNNSVVGGVRQAGRDIRRAGQDVIDFLNPARWLNFDGRRNTVGTMAVPSMANANGGSGWKSEGFKSVDFRTFDSEINIAFGGKDVANLPARGFTEAKFLQIVKSIPTLNKFYAKYQKKYPNMTLEFKDIMHTSDYAQTHYDLDKNTVTDVTVYLNALESYRGLCHVILHEFGHVNSAYHGFYFDNVRKYNPNYYKGIYTPSWIDEIYAHKFANFHGGSILEREQYVDSRNSLLGRKEPIDANKIKLPSFY